MEAKPCPRCGLVTDAYPIRLGDLRLHYHGGNHIDLCPICLAELTVWLFKGIAEMATRL